MSQGPGQTLKDMRAMLHDCNKFDAEQNKCCGQLLLFQFESSTELPAIVLLAQI